MAEKRNDKRHQSRLAFCHDLHQQQVSQPASLCHTLAPPSEIGRGRGPLSSPSPPSGVRQAGLGNEAVRCLRSVLCVRVARELTGVVDPGLAWTSPVRDTQHSTALPEHARQDPAACFFQSPIVCFFGMACTFWRPVVGAGTTMLALTLAGAGVLGR